MSPLACDMTVVIVNFIRALHWLNFAVLHDDSDFGTVCLAPLKHIASENGICIEGFAEYRHFKRNYKEVLFKIYEEFKSRVVVFLGERDSFKNLTSAVKAMGWARDKVWISVEPITTMGVYDKIEERIIPGSFYIVKEFTSVPGFATHFLNLDPRRGRNEWFQATIDDFSQCTDSCSSEYYAVSDRVANSYILSEVYDSISVFANIIHATTNIFCFGAKGSAVRKCIEEYQDEVIQSSQNIFFEGLSGSVTFGPDGHRMSHYYVVQVIPLKYGKTVKKKVAYYDYTMNRLLITDAVDLNMFHEKNHSCAVTCNSNLVKKFIGSCCFACVSCPPSFIPSKDQLECVRCPPFQWSKYKENGVIVCALIEAQSIDWLSPYTIILFVFAELGLFASSATLILFIYCRDHSIIKASCFDLSVLELIAIIIGYLDIALLFTKPTTFWCFATEAMFRLSFNLLYSAMLVNTVRAYGIYTKMACLSWITNLSPVARVWLALGLATIQVLLCTPLTYWYPVRAIRYLPFPDEMYVELACLLPKPLLGAFLASNCTITTVCAVLAYKTRNTMDVFNDSRSLSIFIYTTIIVWLAFLPAHFTNTSNRLLQAYLLAMTLLFNHSTAMLFLFSPKVYAVLCIQDYHNRRSGKKSFSQNVHDTFRHGADRLPNGSPTAKSATTSSFSGITITGYTTSV